MSLARRIAFADHDESLATACSPPACTAAQHPLPPSLAYLSHSLSPSLPDRHMTHAHGSDARHALGRDYPQATRPNQEQSGPTRREREGWQTVRRMGAAGVERNGTRWGHVWAQQRGMQGLAHDSCRAGRVRAGGL